MALVIGRARDCCFMGQKAVGQTGLGLNLIQPLPCRSRNPTLLPLLECGAVEGHQARNKVSEVTQQRPSRGGRWRGLFLAHFLSHAGGLSAGFLRMMRLARSSGTTGQSDRMKSHAGHSRPALGPSTNMAHALCLSASRGRASPHPTCPQPPQTGCWKQTEAKGRCLPFSCPD